MKFRTCRLILAILSFTLIPASFGSVVQANPIALGEFRIELFEEDVHINVTADNGFIQSEVECTATMSVRTHGFDIINTLPQKITDEPPFDIEFGDHNNGSGAISVNWLNNNSLSLRCNLSASGFLSYCGSDTELKLNTTTQFSVGDQPFNVTANKKDSSNVSLNFSPLPRKAIFQFPIPPNSKNIHVITNRNEFQYVFVNNSYRYFKDFDIIEWEVPVLGRDDLSLSVRYDHELINNNGTYNLKYAFGTGRVFVKYYKNIDLFVQLPRNTDINSIEYLPEELSLYYGNEVTIENKSEGTFLSLTESSGFYLPTENVDINFTIVEDTGDGTFKDDPTKNTPIFHNYVLVVTVVLVIILFRRKRKMEKK